MEGKLFEIQVDHHHLELAATGVKVQLQRGQGSVGNWAMSVNGRCRLITTT